MNKKITSKDELTEEALKYDKKKDSGYLTTPSIAYIKGVRRGIGLCLDFVQDSFRSKIEKLIK